MNGKITVETHSHTIHSPDAKSTPDEMCAAAYDRGFAAYTITDHCDVNRDAELGCFARSTASVSDALRLAAEYEGKMRVIAGIELSNMHRDPELAKRCAAIPGIGCIVGSVHRIILDGIEYAGTIIDFASLSDKQIDRLVDRYFEEIHLTLDILRPDILAHPTYMLRYAVGYHHRQVDLRSHLTRLDSVLDRIIDEGIALELNTQIMTDRVADYDRFVLERYHSRGGRLITLASDAHITNRLGNGFDAARRELRELGFERGCYFIDREILTYEL